MEIHAQRGKRRGEYIESTQNKRKLLELREQYKDTPMPDMYRNINMNIPPMQPNVKDEPDLSRSPFLMEPSYQTQYHPQISFTPNIPSASTSQPGQQQIPSFHAVWGSGPSTSYEVVGFPNISNITNTPNIPLVPEVGTTLYDMDSFKQISINTDDLPVTSLTNMSLTDLPPDGMTDSLDRLANNEVDRHLNL
ncbi:hypothetical protein Trydic_g20929 [Trypoxylus dichotomus]